MSQNFEEDVLRALRRITRATDLHSRHLSTTYGLTGPQLVCLRVIGKLQPISPSQLAREVSLSQATITGILDRLAARQLIARARTSVDRRVVTVDLTESGRALVAAAPSPLQETFVSRFTALPSAQQQQIRDTLNQVVSLMGGENLDAGPMLATESNLTDQVTDEPLPPAPRKG